MSDKNIISDDRNENEHIICKKQEGDFLFLYIESEPRYSRYCVQLQDVSYSATHWNKIENKKNVSWTS